MSLPALTEDQAQAEWDAMAAVRGTEAESPAAVETQAADQEPKEVVEQTPEPQAQTPATPQPEQQEEAPDPLASLPEALRERFKSLEAMAQKSVTLEHDLKSAVGRIGAMQREMDAARNAAAVAKAVGDAAPTQAQINAASNSPEKWEQMKADFPDWGEAMEAMVEHRLSGFQPGQRGMSPEQVQELLTQERTTLMKVVEEAKVEVRYPEWKQTINTSEFQQWYTAQDEATKTLADSPRGLDAVALIDKFEKSKAAPVAEIRNDRKERLQAAATTKPGQVTPPKSEDDMDPAELWNYLAKQRGKREAA